LSKGRRTRERVWCVVQPGKVAETGMRARTCAKPNWGQRMVVQKSVAEKAGEVVCFNENVAVRGNR